jgi:hypothetical protein
MFIDPAREISHAEFIDALSIVYLYGLNVSRDFQDAE